MPIPPLVDIQEWLNSLNTDQLLALEQYVKALRDETLAGEAKAAAQQAFIDAQ